MADELHLEEESTVSVKNNIDYTLQRYQCHPSLLIEDVAMIIYRPAATKKTPSLELRYCVAGSRYCHNPACKDLLCMAGGNKADCHPRQNTLDVISISFRPAFLKTLQEDAASTLFELAAKHPFIKTIQPGTKSKIVLEQVIHHTYQGLLKNIFLQSKALELLLYSSDQFVKNDPDEKYGCRFLTQVEDREKVVKARDILLQRLDSPITIRELARKVAMNECYLKKGFKAIYGTTIYDYFQQERMERSRHLLYQKGLSVSEVAVIMGYSCISHFSTAFKKHTGLKPCELLPR